jgi:NMD protein affecting ribosome stability and mRNA decay
MMKCPYCGHESKEKVCPKCFAAKPEKTKKVKTKESSKEE